ncbi:MAG TPA: M23 family metallopeptidase [Chthoniobacterales bacterium]|nr:M23 family metallopeptidase [Chthoniobacterales bacterium]
MRADSVIKDAHMGPKVAICTLSCAVVATTYGQQVEVPREKAGAVVYVKRAAAQPMVEGRSQTVSFTETPSVVAPRLSVEDMRKAGAMAARRVQEEEHDLDTDSDPDPAPPPSAPKKRVAANAVRPVEKVPRASEPPPPAATITFTSQTAFTRLADGFDFPVGKGEARGYYKARGYRAHGHMGEDWDGVGGGDTDLGDPVYVIGDGVVVFARDCHQGWGNVIIVRHAYRESGSVRTVDSLYGHLGNILVHRGQTVRRDQQIATIGNAHGLYDAHLHLEVRKNIAIGMSRNKFAQDSSNYYDPSDFIASHRHLQTSGASTRVAMNTFTYDAKINWDKLRNYSHARTGGGSSESAYALKKALATQNAQ